MAAAWRSVLLTPNVLGKDGVSALSREISRALPAPALIVSLHDDPVAAAASPTGVEIRGARGRRTALVAQVARAACRCSAGTVVVCSHLHLAPIARLLSWRGARPTLVLCGIEAWVPLRRLERRALASADVVAISRHTVDRFKAANPALASIDVTVCHPGLPPAPCPPASPSSMALIVARMSSAERYKGHDALVGIWPRVVERHAGAVLTIAGDGDDRPRIEALARSLGVSHAVRFTGRVSDDELNALYRGCRFFVMPSRDEGFGLVFLEAMRAGKACIGAAGAASEIIEDGVTGLIVPSDSREALAAAVERLYDEPDTWTRLGAAGRARFLSVFTDAGFQARFRQVMARRAAAAFAPSIS
jgi:phosphatidyl-myo-inositol dimannoside synthase